MDLDAINSSLEELRSLDIELSLFGASSHSYELNPMCQLSEIESFESEYGIVLPNDYKLFLCECGNGGAGPYYGLFPLRYYDGAGGPLEQWAEGEGILGTLKESFPHIEPWNLSQDRLEPPDSFASDDEEDEWYEKLDDEYWNPSVANGCIPVAHQGCAIRNVLVVTGVERGHIWIDARAEQKGISPEQIAELTRCSFGEWYEKWLRDSIQTMRQ